MLHALGAPRIALLSNNPDKAEQLVDHGITVARRVPTAVHLSVANRGYLQTKADLGGHDLTLPEEERGGPAYARKHRRDL
jgi:GTP cyclohydrolase II